MYCYHPAIRCARRSDTWCVQIVDWVCCDCWYPQQFCWTRLCYQFPCWQCRLIQGISHCLDSGAVNTRWKTSWLSSKRKWLPLQIGSCNSPLKGAHSKLELIHSFSHSLDYQRCLELWVRSQLLVFHLTYSNWYSGGFEDCSLRKEVGKRCPDQLRAVLYISLLDSLGKCILERANGRKLRWGE